MSSGKQPVFAALRSGGTTMIRRFLQFMRALFFPRCALFAACPRMQFQCFLRRPSKLRRDRELAERAKGLLGLAM